LVFPSLSAIKDNFLLFWNTLSYDGICQNNVMTILSTGETIPAPDKLSKKIVNYPGFKNRNPIAAELQILGGLFLEDVGRIPEAEEEFITTTYCDSGALSQYALVSREILNTRYSTFFEKEIKGSVKPARTKKGIEPELKNDLLTAAMSRRPIILVGDVGVGKSMFIKHLLYVDAKEELRDAIVIYIDFGSKPTFSTELDEYVKNEIMNQLYQNYNIDVFERNFVRGVYNLDIERFSKGIYADLKQSQPDKYKDKEIEYIDKLINDQEKHLRSCINHLVNGRKKQIVVFLDNVDQRPYDFQEKAFLISQSLAETWPVVAFIALRPDTFARSKSTGTLAAYQPRVFTIEPPRVDRVVNMRLKYALDQLKKLGIISSTTSSFLVDSGTLEKYIEMLLKAFSESVEIIEFVDNMSNGNLRKAIEYIGIFVGSAHVDSRKILDGIDNKGFYNLPIHEFIRAIIYKDNEYYNPDDSVLMNVFDISNDNPSEHFIILILLSLVERLGKESISEGFVEIASVYKNLQIVGYSEKEIEEAIKKSLKHNLIAGPGYEISIIPSRLRILTAGAYTLKKLACMFTYVDSMIVDTPVTDKNFREKIHDVQTIEERVERVRNFLEYLEKSWNCLKNEYFDWKEYSEKTRREMHNVQWIVRTRGSERSK